MFVVGMITFDLYFCIRLARVEELLFHKVDKKKESISTTISTIVLDLIQDIGISLLFFLTTL